MFWVKKRVYRWKTQFYNRKSCFSTIKRLKNSVWETGFIAEKTGYSIGKTGFLKKKNGFLNEKLGFSNLGDKPGFSIWRETRYFDRETRFFDLLAIKGTNCLQKTWDLPCLLQLSYGSHLAVKYGGKLFFVQHELPFPHGLKSHAYSLSRSESCGNNVHRERRMIAPNPKVQ